MSVFCYVVPVWGESYSSLFTDVCLPMLMTPGNLGGLLHRQNDRFVIATRMSDWDEMRQTKSYLRLQSLIDVRVIFVDGLVNMDTPHGAMSKCYDLAMRDSWDIDDDVYYVFLTPDSFWSDGTFKRLEELAQEGKKIVLTAGLRTNRNAVTEIIRNRIATSPNNPAFNLSELIALALNNLHELSLAHNWFSTSFLNVWPSHIYWIYKKRFLMAHCFHLHPLLVKAPKHRTRIGNTVDGDFLDNLGYSLHDQYVVQGEFLGVELSPEGRDWDSVLEAPSLFKVIRFALVYAGATHWHNFSHRILYAVDPHEVILEPFSALEETVVKKIMRFRKLRPLFGVMGKVRKLLGKVKKLLKICSAPLLRPVKHMLKRIFPRTNFHRHAANDRNTKVKADRRMKPAD